MNNEKSIPKYFFRWDRKCISCKSENVEVEKLKALENSLNIENLKLCECKNCGCIWQE